MELIIKISEDVLKRLREQYIYFSNSLEGTVLEAVANGVQLPKGHGRLIDADAFERRCMFDSDIEDMQDVIYALRDYKSIIEADKEQEE